MTQMELKLKRNPTIPTSQIMILEFESSRRLPQELGQVGLALQNVSNLSQRQQIITLSVEMVSIPMTLGSYHLLLGGGGRLFVGGDQNFLG